MGHKWIDCIDENRVVWHPRITNFSLDRSMREKENYINYLTNLGNLTISLNRLSKSFNDRQTHVLEFKHILPDTCNHKVNLEYILESNSQIPLLEVLIV